ncbi:uncharacterized protein LOC120265197 [Dioscorea cayenensis subsp. rotundata]|uniref:Uncharacterized protein LOC120265197 n=1 Tax=Dioscorea cayennensis subsp. rotundata TaxID=55577 RepID=A0AB40BNN0_DIOCR|nr:uncharacterized protein LOC120265197 [Dioscorea cayenensis subsp. rotundata]
MDGICYTEHKDIEHVFSNFFTNLWSDTSANSVSDLVQALPDDLPTISQNDGESLIAEVSKKEVFYALKSLPSGKSPGPDGLNSEFYCFFWNDLGDSLFEAISYFFNNSVIPNSWGQTFITFVPKKPNPHSVTDFRPISLCNVCYKIIAKILAIRIKNVLPKIIGRERCGFVSNRSPFDNIIALQEVVHSMDRDSKNPPRMLVKLDIEKAYDTLSWNAILATLYRMNFPSRWISWIKACISSASFSFLINRQPSPWIKSSRGLRQGDPLSSYLFIIVAQNLTALLNFSLRQNMIPGFNLDLNRNFNHLMYADDLILVTHATRKTARNINLCFSIYDRLTSQRANKSKSDIYFPSRFNHRLRLSICRILGFTTGSFPFTYLGISISPKRLALSNFSRMLDKTERILSNWSHSKISMAGKTILINSILMSIPVYYLSVYPVPDSVLDGITKAATAFFWSKGGNRKGMNSVNWTDITLGHSEGGLSIRNLRASKISLMAKNVLSYLNHHDAIWVDILINKYGIVNFWTDSIPSNCSWFFRCLCHNANLIKPLLWLYHINPNLTDIMFHPWYFEITLAFKPTYLNMNVNLDLLRISDLLIDNAWNLNLLHDMFGDFLNFDYLTCDKSSHCDGNWWVWYPKSKNHRLTSMVYTHFNGVVDNIDPWIGWRFLWRLKIAPRPKHFFWMLLHNGIKTYDYHYRLNLGPQTLCRFCNLDFETAEHLFNSCPKAQATWLLISNFIGKQILFHDGFSNGNWLCPSNPDLNIFDQSVIVATAWLLWKARCNLIFQSEVPDFISIAIRAINHVREYSYSYPSHSGNQMILNNFTYIDSPFLFISSKGSCETGSFGAGFYLISANSQLLCRLVLCNITAESPIEAEAFALIAALGSLQASDHQIKTIFMANDDLHSTIKAGYSHHDWRINPLIINITDYLICFGRPAIFTTPSNWLSAASSLALLGINSHILTLFHQGRDLPYWLMKLFLRLGVSL